MKTILSIPSRLAIGLLSVALLWSCDKYQELADAPYPDQVIYMPTASGFFQVARPDNTYEVPTPGQPYHFRVDPAEGNVVIPLGIVRGGISNKGAVSINVGSQSDTVVTLIEQQQLNAELLPATAYVIPAAITLPDGKNSISFDLKIDLQYLLDRPGQVFALAIHISSTERKTNPELDTTIVVFDTDLLADEIE